MVLEVRVVPARLGVAQKVKVFRDQFEASRRVTFVVEIDGGQLRGRVSIVTAPDEQDMSVSAALPRLRRLRLRRRASAIDSFRLEASIGSQRVKAVWNGRHLELSDGLHRLAEMAVAIDDAFADAGLPVTEPRSTLDRNPEAVMLTLINCCDTVQVAEYSSEGRRRLLSP